MFSPTLRTVRASRKRRSRRWTEARELVDVLDHHGSAPGLLQDAHGIPVRTGEGAFDVAEELAHHEVLVALRAAPRIEGHALPAPALVDELGQDALARSAGAQQEHGRVEFRHDLRLGQRLEGGRAAEEEGAQAQDVAPDTRQDATGSETAGSLLIIRMQHGAPLPQGRAARRQSRPWVSRW